MEHPDPNPASQEAQRPGSPPPPRVPLPQALRSDPTLDLTLQDGPGLPLSAPASITEAGSQQQAEPAEEAGLQNHGQLPGKETTLRTRQTKGLHPRSQRPPHCKRSQGPGSVPAGTVGGGRAGLSWQSPLPDAVSPSFQGMHAQDGGLVLLLPTRRLHFSLHLLEAQLVTWAAGGWGPACSRTSHHCWGRSHLQPCLG